uniref:Uncharacterized protein n=1 Tax=viral metagenome TaxID=1070528 RepID=A0A6C0CCA5_9ZZZZ
MCACKFTEIVTLPIDVCTLMNKKGASVSGIQIIFSVPEVPLPKDTVTIVLPAGTELKAMIANSNKIWTLIVPERTLCEIPNNTAVTFYEKMTMLISSSNTKPEMPVIAYNVSFPKGTLLGIKDKLREISVDLFKTIVLLPNTKIIVLPETFTYFSHEKVVYRSKTDEEQIAYVPQN